MDLEPSLAYEELLKNHQRDINCLVDDDRNLRKKGLTTILKTVLSAPTPAKEALQFFQINAIKNLLRAIEDPIEKNRELAQNIIAKFCERSKENAVPIDREVILQILQKLCVRVNVIPFAEQSEELRLLIVLNMTEIVKLFSNDVLPILGDFAVSLARLLQDSFPEVKKSGANLVEECAVHLKNNIGYHGIQIAKQLAKNMEHQHSKVRKVTLQALTNLLLCEGAGCLYEHVGATYGKAVNDKINEVRKMAYESVARLLNGFSIANLRLFEADLVILLLNSLSDEVNEFSVLGRNLVEECGMRRKLLAIEINEKIDF